MSVTNYYSQDELSQLGLGSFGSDVRISRRASLYGLSMMYLGDHVRIDDFTVITAREKMTFGNYVHISCLSFLHGHRSIEIGDFAQVSSRVGIFTSSAEMGDGFSHPLLPSSVKQNPPHAPIKLEHYCVVGTGSTILQGVTLGEGCAVGAHSLVSQSLPEWSLCFGVPAKFQKPRQREAVLKELLVLPVK